MNQKKIHITQFVTSINSRLSFFKFLPLLFIILICEVSSQVIIVPLETQLPIIKKIIEFDKNSKYYADQNKTFKIGIVFQSGYKLSNGTRFAIQNISEDQKLNYIFGKNIEYIPLDLSNGSDISKMISSANIRVAFITPMRAVALEKVSNALKISKVLSITLVSDYLENDFSVGIDYKGDKPQILMNLTSSKEENADFSPQILKLVKILK